MLLLLAVDVVAVSTVSVAFATNVACWAYALLAICCDPLLLLPLCCCCCLSAIIIAMSAVAQYPQKNEKKKHRQTSNVFLPRRVFDQVKYTFLHTFCHFSCLLLCFFYFSIPTSLFVAAEFKCYSACWTCFAANAIYCCQIMDECASQISNARYPLLLGITCRFHLLHALFVYSLLKLFPRWLLFTFTEIECHRISLGNCCLNSFWGQ